jgi:hypothetical protein
MAEEEYKRQRKRPYKRKAADYGINQQQQMLKDRALLKDTQDAMIDEHILTAITNGKSILEIAQNLDWSTTNVRGRISQLVEAYRDTSADHAEFIYNVNHMRLEKMFSESMEAAFSGNFRDKESRGWAQLALNIIKEQNRMSETQLKHLNSNDDDDGSGKNVTNNLTIVSGDEMFKMAQEAMSQQNKLEYGGNIPQIGAPDGTSQEEMLSALIAPFNPDHVQDEMSLPVVTDIEKKIEKLEKELNVNVDADDTTQHKQREGS